MSGNNTFKNWHVSELDAEGNVSENYIFIEPGVCVIERMFDDPNNDDMKKANLLAAAPELLEALEDCIDAQWHIDSHAVPFDGTVLFSELYDFDGLDGTFREEFLAEYECVVWPSGGKWSAYCTYERSMWFEQFDNVRDAKEQCMKLLDIVLPEHPDMKARAVIAKARGVQP